MQQNTEPSVITKLCTKCIR